MAVSQLRARGRRAEERHMEGRALFDDLLAIAGSLAESRREDAASQLEALADSMRQFGGSMPPLPGVERYVETAADSLEELAGYVLDREIPDMFSDARDLARRHPLATLGGSIVAGVVITQLVQSRTENLRSALRARRGSGRKARRRNAGTAQ